MTTLIALNKKAVEFTSKPLKMFIGCKWVDAISGKKTEIRNPAKGGRHLQIGVTSKVESGYISIPIDEMLMKGIHLYTTLGLPVHRFDKLLASVAQGDLQPGRMVSGEVALSDVNQIFEDMSSFSNTGTYVIKF